MSFKIFFCSLFFMIFFGCGVKTKPSAPDNSSLPSIVDKYAKKINVKEDAKKNEKKK